MSVFVIIRYMHYTYSHTGAAPGFSFGGGSRYYIIFKQLFDYVIFPIQYGKNSFFIRSFTNLCFIQGTCFFPAVFIEIVIINMPIFVRDLCMCSRRGDEKNQQQKKGNTRFKIVFEKRFGKDNINTVFQENTMQVIIFFGFH